MTLEARTERLLRLAAAVEETIIRLESRSPEGSRETVFRLRRLQADILTAVSSPDADAPAPITHD